MARWPSSEHSQMRSSTTRLLDEFSLISHPVDVAKCIFGCRESLIGATQFSSGDLDEYPICDVTLSTGNLHDRIKGTLASGTWDRPSAKHKSNILSALTTQLTNHMDRCDSPHLMGFVDSISAANDSSHVDFVADNRIVKRSQQDPPTCD